MKKCPPGVICIENITLFILFIILIIFIYFIHINLNNKEVIINNTNENPNPNPNPLFNPLFITAANLLYFEQEYHHLVVKDYHNQ